MESLMITTLALVWLTIKVSETDSSEGIYHSLRTITAEFIS